MEKRSGWFRGLEHVPSFSILGIRDAYNNDSNPKKINLAVGAYRDENGQPFTLPSVHEAKRRIYNNEVTHEYTNIDGIPEFNYLTTKLVLGDKSEVITSKRYVTCQTVAGANALRLGADLLSCAFGEENRIIFQSNPTFSVIHEPVFRRANFTVKFYRYYDKTTRGLDIIGCLDDIYNMPKNTAILFQVCSHNPTGVDPTMQQWKEISAACKSRNLCVFFDMAYQGFATGDVDYDAFPVRHFIEQSHNVMIAQSFSKNMGLYGERVGALIVVTEDRDEAERVLSHLKIIIRSTISNPPIFGARIATEILGNAKLYKLWRKDLKVMANRNQEMRKLLKQRLIDEGSTLNWDHIVNQIGMFCFTGLSEQQVQILRKEHSIYMTPDGRISMSGITRVNVAHLAKAIHSVTK